MAEHSKKLHITVFPWLAFGHILPYFELSKLIAQKGHQISFISTTRNIQRLPKPPSNLQPFIELIEIPLPRVDNLPEDAEATMDIPHHIVPYLKKAFDGLEQPLAKFLERSTPDWIIHVSFAIDLIRVHEPPFGESPTKVVALKPFEQKSVSRDHIEQNESGVSDIFRLQAILQGTHALATRSCRKIDGESLKLLETLFQKPVIPVGLLPPSLQFSEDSRDDNWETIAKWLDKQEKGSVVYIAFGSEVALSKEDFTEIALGLDLSGLPFFWTLKKLNDNPAMNSSDSVELPDWLECQRNRRGLVWMTWAPQRRILVHKSIGAFLTHCDWSSVTESLQVGCPLIMLYAFPE